MMMRTMTLLRAGSLRACLLSLSLMTLVACGASESPEPTPGPAPQTPAPQSSSPQTPAAAATGCAAASHCAACLATPGCNWTGGTCSAECLMDVSCYGPGNPAAASCPAVDARLMGEWQEDHGRSDASGRLFVRGDGALGPARFRQRYTFGPEGRLTAGILAPDDGHYSVEGRWWQEGDVIYGQWQDPRTGGGSFAFRLVSVSATELRLGEPAPMED